MTKRFEDALVDSVCPNYEDRNELNLTVSNRRFSCLGHCTPAVLRRIYGKTVYWFFCTIKIGSFLPENPSGRVIGFGFRLACLDDWGFCELAEINGQKLRFFRACVIVPRDMIGGFGVFG